MPWSIYEQDFDVKYLYEYATHIRKEFLKLYKLLISSNPGPVSSNSGEKETFLFDFSPKCCHFCTNSRYGSGLQANNRPKKEG